MLPPEGDFGSIFAKDHLAPITRRTAGPRHCLSIDHRGGLDSITDYYTVLKLERQSEWYGDWVEATGLRKWVNSPHWPQKCFWKPPGGNCSAALRTQEGTGSSHDAPVERAAVRDDELRARGNAEFPSSMVRQPRLPRASREPPATVPQASRKRAASVPQGAQCAPHGALSARHGAKTTPRRLKCPPRRLSVKYARHGA